jgi:hypothetical protein
VKCWRPAGWWCCLSIPSTVTESRQRCFSIAASSSGIARYA